MPFINSDPGSLSNFSLTGTDGIDITTVTGSTPNVTVDSGGGNDQITVQNTNGVVNGLVALLGDGDDRIFADSSPNSNSGSVVLTNSLVRGGFGDDILFGSAAGIADTNRTVYLNYSTVNGNQGNDLIRVFGALVSRIEGGTDQDTIELANLAANPVTGALDGIIRAASGPAAANVVAYSPDRYDGSTVQGGLGTDVIRLTLGNTNVVNTRINGNQDEDLISNFGVALTGNWENSTIFGGQGDDEINLQTNVTSSLFVLGNLDDDTILTGTGNDTVIGGDGDDNINIAGGDNLVIGDNAPFIDGTSVDGSGDDEITINGIALAGSNTVFAGAGDDIVTIFTDGNNIVQLAAGDDDAFIQGDGNNSITGDDGDDVMEINGAGINTIFGGAGDDTLIFRGTTSEITAAGFGGAGDDSITLDNGLNATLEGGEGDDTIIIDGSGNIQVGGGSGDDFIDFITTVPSSASVNGGTGADLINEFGSFTRFVQLNGDSVAATSVTDTGLSTWSAGDVISYATTGVDIITGFDVANDLFETTLGDLGLDQTTLVGAVYGAFGTETQGGMVAGKTFYLSGNWDFALETFTVTANGGGLDTLLITAGNNGPMTGNANSVVLDGFINTAGTLLTNANFDTFLG